MTTDLQLFVFGTEDVRVLEQDGEPWFVAADIARVLGYSTTAAMTRSMDDDERGVQILHTPSGAQSMTVISEPGLYGAIIRSRVEGAQRFKRWLKHEVLPTLRKTGSYEVQAISLPEALRRYADEVEARERAEAQVIVARQQVAALEAPAASWQALASSDGDYSVEQAAKILSRDPHIEIGRDRLFELLRELRWVFRSKEHGMRRPWAAYQSAIQTGRLVHRARSHAHPHTGATVLDAPQVRVTAKGLDDLRRHLGSTSPLLQLEEVNA